MNRPALIVGAALALVACNSKPTVEETNASVEDVSQAVREASKDRGLIRPGKWDSKVTIEKMDIPGMPPEAAKTMQAAMERSRTAQVCLTPEQAKQPSFFSPSDKCRYDSFTMKRGKIDATMRCAGEGGAVQVMDMEGTYSPNSYDMRMKSRTETGSAGEAITMEMRVESKRVGECDPKKG